MCRKPPSPGSAFSYFGFPLLPTALASWDVWLPAGRADSMEGGCWALLEQSLKPHTVVLEISHVGLGNREREIFCL